MSLRLYAVYLLTIEVGLVLLLVGVFPIATNEISNSGENAVGFLIFLAGLILGIVLVLIGLYKVAVGTAKPFARLGNTHSELTVIRLIKKQPAFAIPALFTTILPLLFITAIILLPGWIHVFPADIVKSAGAYVNPIVAVLLFIFGVVFVIVFLQIFGLLVTGELLQRRLTQGHHNFFVHMLKNVIIALPYAILYSLVFLFVALARKKDSNESALEAAVKNTSILAGLQVLKYYIYANLSSVAFEDRYTYTTMKDSVQYVRSNAGSLFSVFANSALISGVAFLYVFALMAWAGRTPFLSEDILMGAAFSLAAIVVAWIVFVEQVLFLLNYIRIRHPNYDIESFVDNKPNKLVCFS